MEINVTKNLLTGENTVVSTATVPAEELKHHAGLKVYDDGRKCVYALNSREVCSDEHTSKNIFFYSSTRNKVSKTLLLRHRCYKW